MRLKLWRADRAGKIGKLCQSYYLSRQGDLAMATMNISLPDQMKEWVEQQVATGRYANASDFVRDLIREEQQREVGLKELRKLIDEAEASGVSGLTVEDIRRQVRQELGIDDADAA